MWSFTLPLPIHRAPLTFLTHITSVSNAWHFPPIFWNLGLIWHESFSKNRFPKFWSQGLPKIPTLVATWAHSCWGENLPVTLHHLETANADSLGDDHVFLLTSLPDVFVQQTDEHIGMHKVGKFGLSLWPETQVGFLKWQQSKADLHLQNFTSDDLL